jgi:ABC-type phosphate transport system substrate-binding protein
MRTSRALALTLAVSLLAGATQGEPREAQAFQVIVHPSNPADSVDRKFLADAFLKKATRWTHQTVIQPVDQDADTGTRRRFSQEVLSRSVSAVKSYWQQLIFSGRDVPPPELDTDEQVIQYVRMHPGAIGYVSADAEVSGVKILKVR